MILSLTAAHQAATTANTGHHAPISGWWRSDDDEREEARFINQGDIMPTCNGLRTLWKLAPFTATSTKEK